MAAIWSGAVKAKYASCGCTGKWIKARCAAYCARRQQFDKLESVDLRYDGQIIVNPDLEGMPRQPALTPAAAKAAIAAGVKQAAIVNYEKYVTHPPTPGPAKPAKAAQKAPAKHAFKKAAHQPRKAARKTAASTATKNHPAPFSTSTPRAAATSPKPVVTKAPTHSSSPAPAASTTGQKKPSPTIPKETVQN